MTRVELTVPDDWSMIELTDPVQRHRQIDALVAQRVGRGDDRATLRRHLRDQLVSQADQAARVGAWLLAFLFLVADGMPVPASLTARQQPWPTAVGGLDPLAERLAQELGDGAVDRGTGRFGSFVRTVVYQDVAVDDQQFRVMTVDYWCDVERDALVGLTFCTPMVLFDAELLDLFDAITSTLVVRDDLPTAGPADQPVPSTSIVRHP